MEAHLCTVYHARMRFIRAKHELCTPHVLSPNANHYIYHHTAPFIVAHPTRNITDKLNAQLLAAPGGWRLGVLSSGDGARAVGNPS